MTAQNRNERHRPEQRRLAVRSSWMMGAHLACPMAICCPDWPWSIIKCYSWISVTSVGGNIEANQSLIDLHIASSEERKQVLS